MPEGRSAVQSQPRDVGADTRVIWHSRLSTSREPDCMMPFKEVVSSRFAHRGGSRRRARGSDQRVGQMWADDYATGRGHRATMVSSSSSRHGCAPHQYTPSPCACSSHSPALCISKPVGGSVGRPSCVNVGSRRRARGNSLPAVASARHSRFAVAGSERSAQTWISSVSPVASPGEEVDLVALGSQHVGHVAAPGARARGEPPSPACGPGWPGRLGRRPGSAPGRHRESPHETSPAGTGVWSKCRITGEASSSNER